MRTRLYTGLLFAILALASVSCGNRTATQGPEASPGAGPAAPAPARAPAVDGTSSAGGHDVAASDEVLVYRIGIPAGEGGRSELRVSADGATAVENQQGAAPPRRFDGSVPADTLPTLLRKLDEAGLWNLHKRATAVPDEPPIEIELRRGGGAVRSVALWRNQLRETAELRAVQGELDRLIREASGGKVY